MYATFENLLQQVMSHFLDFDVTEQDKLRGIDNYKLWAAMVKSQTAGPSLPLRSVSK